MQSTSSFWIWSAFKMRQDYIAGSLCVNRFDQLPICKGSCYLEKQLENDRNQQEKLPDLKFKEVTLYVVNMQAKFEWPNSVPHEIPVYYTAPEGLISSSFHPSVFQPPDDLM